MASLANHHLPSLLFLGFLYILITNGDSIDHQSPITTCPPSDCGGNGIKIGYPFWHQSQQFQHHCGYPNFNISCTGQTPTFYLSSDSYYPIKNINYSNKSLTLVYTELKDTGNCPKVPPRDVTLNNSLLDHTSGNKMLHFFYNCTLYPPSLPHIACLQYGTRRSYVFVEGAIPEFDWHRYCESTVTAPVIDKAALNGDLVKDFGQALQDGFKLTWKQPPDGACRSCEATGGFCAYNNGLQKNFFCICTDGRRSANCDYKGALISVNPEPNYVFVSIAALIFGGLVMATTVFYLIQKKKAVSYKPV